LTCIAVPHVFDKLQFARIGRLPWEKEVSASPATGPKAAPIATGEAVVGESENRATVNNSLAAKKEPLDPALLAQAAGSLAIEHQELLDGFYTQLAKTIAKKEPHLTRVMHYGDSVIASDYISGTTRRLFHDTFGDGGHGFILTANGWDWYFHNDITHYATAGWSKSAITGPFARDHRYGLGGVVFLGAPGASATFATPTSGDYGRKASRFDIYYLAEPTGGELEIKLGKDVQILSTRATTTESKVARYTVPDGEAKMVIRVLGKGTVRVYGVAMERDVAGVSYDALGALGARAQLWNGIDEAHWREQFALRKPALIVLQFGTNESEDGLVSEAEYTKQVVSLIEKVKAAAPKEASILVAAPLDRAERGPGGALRSSKALTRLVGFQEAIAKDHGVAFWNTWKAMGGEGTMVRWLNAKPQLCSGDLTHPTPKGAEVIGNLLFKALTSGYEAWASKHPDAPPLPKP
jgi:lysophospholipase L1-like esterase